MDFVGQEMPTGTVLSCAKTLVVRVLVNLSVFESVVNLFCVGVNDDN